MNGKIICVIRISGKVGYNKKIVETLNRLRLRRKYSCVVIVNPSKNQEGMIEKVRSNVAYGEISEPLFLKLIESRGQFIDKKKKTDLKKAFEGLKKGGKYEELNLKPFFRLHPPRKGIKSKEHFPKGVLGNNKEKINDLVERML